MQPTRLSTALATQLKQLKVTHWNKSHNWTQSTPLNAVHKSHETQPNSQTTARSLCKFTFLMQFVTLRRDVFLFESFHNGVELNCKSVVNLFLKFHPRQNTNSISVDSASILGKVVLCLLKNGKIWESAWQRKEKSPFWSVWEMAQYFVRYNKRLPKGGKGGPDWACHDLHRRDTGLFIRIN